jgi:hypothetical protein
MSLEEIHARRLAANKILKDMFWAAKKLDHIHLTSEDLRTLNVQLSSFDLRGGGNGCAVVGSGIQFFDPMPQRSLEALPIPAADFYPPDNSGISYEVTTTESYGNFEAYLSLPVHISRAKQKLLIEFGSWEQMG